MNSVSVKKIFCSCFFILSCVFSAAVALPDVPPLTGRVVDMANMISPTGKMKVAEEIQRLEKVTGGQMAVLTMPSLGGDSLEDFSMRVAEKWKIGRKGQDNGIILLIVKDSHQIRLEVGYGWEGVINDARAGDIIREMVAFFRNGKIDEGICFAVLKVSNTVSGKNTPVASSQKGKKESAPLNPVIIIMIVIIAVISGLFRRRYHGNTYNSGGGGGFGGGGFSGGGGSFGGGGASGRW